MLKLRTLKIFSYVILLKILNAFISWCFQHFPEMATRSQIRGNTARSVQTTQKKKPRLLQSNKNSLPKLEFKRQKHIFTALYFNCVH